MGEKGERELKGWRSVREEEDGRGSIWLLSTYVLPGGRTHRCGVWAMCEPRRGGKATNLVSNEGVLCNYSNSMKT